VIQPEQVISVWSISVARKSLCLIHRSGSPLSLTERCIIWVQTAERARRRRTGYVLRVPAAVSSMYCTVLYMRISILYRGHLCPTAKPCMALSACSTSKTECFCYPWYYLLRMRPSGILAPIGHRTADRYLSAPTRPIGGMARFAAPPPQAPCRLLEEADREMSAAQGPIGVQSALHSSPAHPGPN